MIENNSNKLIWTAGAIAVATALIFGAQTVFPKTLNIVGSNVETAMVVPEAKSNKVAYSDTQVDFYFDEKTKTAVAAGLKSVSQQSPDVVIPKIVVKDNVEYLVTAIGAKAFYTGESGMIRQISLNSVEIPDSVQIIGESGFKRNALKTIDIPDSVRDINQDAFFHNQLTSVKLSKSVKSIGVDAFGFNQLQSVVIPNGVEVIERYAFDYNRLTSVIIPASVKKIGNNAFARNQLTTVNVPRSIIMGRDVFDANPLVSMTRD